MSYYLNTRTNGVDQVYDMKIPGLQIKADTISTISVESSTPVTKYEYDGTQYSIGEPIKITYGKTDVYTFVCDRSHANMLIDILWQKYVEDINAI